MDLHIKGFRNMGYQITEGHGLMEGKAIAAGGHETMLDVPSVGATENIMMAASMTRERPLSEMRRVSRKLSICKTF